ncbi:TonB-dependent receptor [Novispirillum itersonii]|uniref:Outer membrane receptor for monomeric catechols n=1 Tax=Novispirillum itersonii TaxID=189 RepID=A0A7W9ZK84_NOVIT|nr:STN domain-containing protein [Novispirillum itersonii]MBB6212473.1 outer membrane receptor for monomeric catechols [Novispirillum itersonii]
MTRSALSLRTALLASAALLSGLPVLITAPVPAAAQQAPAARPFDIPAQPLAAAIAAYGRQSGVQVSLRAEDATGRTSAAVSGTLTAEAALTRLLQGTGLTAATATDGTVTLLPLPAAPAGAAVLAPLSVAGTVTVPGDSSPWEPTEGYTARRVATASKTDAPLIRTPQSVSVVTRDQIDAQKADSVVEALRYTPGVVGESFGIDTRYDWTLIRGFSQAETGLFRDGLQLRSTGYASWRQEPYGAERIEVLRGPASVLYGQGDVGGLDLPGKSGERTSKIC